MTTPISPDDLKTLLEFMRFKAPELNIRQNQLARILFVFFISNTLLFLLIFDGIGAVTFSLKQGTDVYNLFFVNDPRPYIILGATVVAFFFFMRFGYLYYQGTKDIVSTHNLIGKMLPLDSIRGTHLVDMREGLMQHCKSNYIIQTMVVFLYPPSDRGYLKFEDGPLSGSGAFRVGIIKILMIMMIICIGWFIAISQFMMIVVFLSFTNVFVSFLLVVTFLCYYGFYLEYVFSAAIKLREPYILALSGFALSLVIVSSLANATLLVNHSRAARIFECRMTWAKIDEVSFFAKPFLAFLFDKESAEAAKPGIPLCPLGLTRA